ncbi:MAG TPA: glycerol-3-phosphate 1-O-acyltransferase PlsY [Myxococcaceae bacterium]|nr:glycerol-3-phosphate 1-O-acyltransferase PlsY [Myxococcaceae bacterium]
MSLWLLALLGYLSGSIPFGLLLARWARGVDVREVGSGNIGATNVVRAAGKGLGLLVLVLDALKGALPVSLTLRLIPGEPIAACVVGACAVLGHVFPVWLRLRGGKGVATAAGVLGVLAPWALLAGAGVWLVTFGAFRMGSLASLLGALAAVVVAFSVATHSEVAWLTGFVCSLIVWRHRGNLRRLWRRTEHRF